MLFALLALLLLTTSCVAQLPPLTAWSATPFNPPSLPLAVKSSYLNVWAPLGYGNASAPLNNAWPRTWDRSLTPLGWYGAIRVDGTAYRFLGEGDLPAGNLQKGFTFTPTQSSYLYQFGPVNVNITFLSPIEPTDLTRQSMPFSYMYLTVQPNDGGSHSVQLFSDVSGEFIGGDFGVPVNWTINESSDFVYLQMNPSSPLPFQELNERPQDGTLYYCMKKTDGVSWQIANNTEMHIQFNNGSITTLPKTSDGSFHAVGLPYFDTLAIAVDLGTVSSVTDPVVYALGVVRDPVVQYANRNVQIEKRSSYYWSNFSTIHDVVNDVLSRFDDAVTAATALDKQILGAAGQVSTNYADILSLSTRQVMGGLEYTLLKDDSGNFNMSDVKAFLNDMGGIGTGGVSAVDVLYAAMPAYLYLNPDILGYLLSPLLEYQESTQYTNPYAAQDLGPAFPNATGNANGHNQKIEQSANMIIMCLAHAQASGDSRLINQHYDLLNKWANYLVNNTMDPGDQTASLSDGIIVNNQTNVVLKGIIGIGAMSKISGYTGHTADETNFVTIAQQYAQQWTSIAVDSSQISISFGLMNSGLIYNLYADKLLQLNLIPSSVYDTQTQFYKSQLSQWNYGIPMDLSNTSSVARADWMMFAAASTSDISIRDAMHLQIHEYISAFLPQNLPFPILYNPRDGTQIGGENSPAIGATFANLALNLPIKSISVTGLAGGGNSTKNTAAIVGGAVGGVVGLLGIIGASIFFYRRRRRSHQESVSQYNRVDRIDRFPSGNFPSSSMLVLDPQDSSAPSQMTELTTTPYTHRYTDDSGSFLNVTGSMNVAPTSSGTRTISAKEWESRGAVCGTNVSVSEAPPSTAGSSTLSSSALPNPHSNHPRQGDWRAEVEVLRQEIEQIRQEREGLAAPPPAYEDELQRLQALGSR
ncbi:DUF1793-domain-containing protein [Fomitiporia mediterranea MF3/22]|uniref:DUF1793-domain-containing protein n=1 Tax=Fomitiporia mediterranea (strain MF3/22) TaxID=694068 RepID=UPI000440848A|nr:DUF1793-domain-containing protein [Fomitiporia mediterranea MF3/22]EJC98586.1 DUF1793-domain-containing protein [Fomitiporia mediterranea MF3/22]